LWYLVLVAVCLIVLLGALGRITDEDVNHSIPAADDDMDSDSDSSSIKGNEASLPGCVQIKNGDGSDAFVIQVRLGHGINILLGCACQTILLNC
jgi:hypothetical protein